MPDSIEQYAHRMLQTIAGSPIVAASTVLLDKRTARSGLIRGDLTMLDGSRLYFRELVDTGSIAARQMYSYHYQSETGTLIFRYDDTPHHRHPSGFPHHKHADTEKNVIAATPPDLAQILREVESTVDFGPGVSA